MDLFANVVIFLLILTLIFLVIAIRRTGKIKDDQEALIRYLSLLIDQDIIPESDKQSFNPSESNHSAEKDKDPDLRREEREETNRRVLMETLQRISCQPKLNQDSNIEVAFQGENFLIQFNGAFIRVWDLSWFSTKSTDDNFTLLKDAVNYANFSFGPTLIMHSPDENGLIHLSSRMDILFVPDQNDNEGYIAALLDSFFGIKQNLQREVARLKENPQDRTFIDNPIGFDTATLSDPTSPQAN